MDRLLTVLRERDTGLDVEDVKWAFDSSKTRDEITLWVDEYLNTSTLLSQNEFEM